MFAPAFLLGLALPLVSGSAGDQPLEAAAPHAAAEVIADIRVQGNVLTSDAEVRRIAAVEVGMPFSPTTVEDVTARLKMARRFERVEVLKRFASIADPTQVALVIVVDEGPVRVEMTGDPDHPTRVVRARGPGLLFLPILEAEDGYGLTYGVRTAWPNVAGPGSRLSFPLSWGGDKRAAIEFEKPLANGPLDRVLAGTSVGRRENPYFGQDDDRVRVWLRGERAIVPHLRAGAVAGRQHLSFLGADDSFTQGGADVTLDTRLDPALPRNAVYARAGWDHLRFSDRSLNRTELDARGYVGLFGQNTLVVRAAREDATGALPPSLKWILGGMDNLRGFPAGTAIGDTLVSGSLELMVPLTSPLRIGKMGVSAFTDVGATYDEGQRMADVPFRQGWGGSVWLAAAFVRLNLAVAHGVGASTRVHFSAAASF